MWTHALLWLQCLSKTLRWTLKQLALSTVASNRTATADSFLTSLGEELEPAQEQGQEEQQQQEQPHLPQNQLPPSIP